MPRNNDHLPPDEVLVPILRQVGAGDLAAVLATCRAFYRLRAEYLLPVLRRKFRRNFIHLKRFEYLLQPPQSRLTYDEHKMLSKDEHIKKNLLVLREAGAKGNCLAVVAVGRALLESLPAIWRRDSTIDGKLDLRGEHYNNRFEVPFRDVEAYLSYETLRLLMAGPDVPPTPAVRFFARVMAERMAPVANVLTAVLDPPKDKPRTLGDYQNRRDAVQLFKVWEDRVGAVCQSSVLSWSPAKLPALRALSSELIGRGVVIEQVNRLKRFKMERYRYNPLHLAAATVEDSTLLAVLARVGFDPEGEDSNGLTPSDHAEAAGLVGNVATLAALAASRRAEK